MGIGWERCTEDKHAFNGFGFYVQRAKGGTRYNVLVPFGDVFHNIIFGFFLIGGFSWMQEKLKTHDEMNEYLHSGIDMGMNRLNVSLNLSVDGKFCVITLKETDTNILFSNAFEQRALRSSLMALTGDDKGSSLMGKIAHDARETFEKLVGEDLDSDGIVGDPSSILTEEERESLKPFVPTFNSEIGVKLNRKILNYASSFIGADTLRADINDNISMRKYVFALTYEDWKDLRKQDRKLRLLLVREDLLKKLYAYSVEDLDRIKFHEMYGGRTGWMSDRINILRKLAKHYFERVAEVEDIPHEKRKPPKAYLCIGSVILSTTLDQTAGADFGANAIQ